MMRTAQAELGDGRALVKADFFISRTGQDKEIALAIAQLVRDAGHTTWLQDEDFGHASFMARMEQGFDSGARVIALLSSGYQRSDYCRKEYNVALSGDPLNLNERLIVVRVDECQPAGNLRDIAYTDLVPILAIADERQRADHLDSVVRVLIGDEVRQAELDLVAIYRRAAQQILHPEIMPVPGFTGREAELEMLQQALWRKGGTAAITNSNSTSAAVRGLGGVGKSVLAREYAWRQRELYHGVWWVRAESRETLFDDLVDLGARLGIAGINKVPEREKAARLAIDTLSQAGFAKPWLIVYDNVEEPKHIDWLTPRTGAHVLITTRWSDWYGRAAELPVGVFAPEVAIEYLMGHARAAEHDPEGTRAASGRLAEDLGYLPLALSHARSYCWGMNWSFDQYRARLPELIRKAPRNAEYPAAVFATFDLAIEKAAKACPEAEKLMSIVAFMAADRIPLDIVTSDVMSEIERGEAVAALAELSLVHIDLDKVELLSFSVHRLVQEVARSKLRDEKQLATFGNLTMTLLANALERIPRGNVQMYSRYFHHVPAVARNVPESETSDALVARLDRASDERLLDIIDDVQLMVERSMVMFSALKNHPQHGQAISENIAKLEGFHRSFTVRRAQIAQPVSASTTIPEEMLVTEEQIHGAVFIETHRDTNIFRLVDGRFYIDQLIALSTIEHARATLDYLASGTAS